MGITRDCTGSNEELTSRNFPHILYKVSTPVYERHKVSIILGSTRIADSIECLLRWDTKGILVTACC